MRSRLRKPALILLCASLLLGVLHCSEKDEEPEAEKGEQGEKGDPGDAQVLKDSDGNELGSVRFSDWPRIVAKLSNDGEVIVRASDGGYLGGLCEGSYCTLSMGTLFNKRGNEFGYCYFTSTNCTGECLLADKPVVNAVFRKTEDDFVIATGDEESTATTARSFLTSDASDCTSSSSSTSTSSFYPVTETYEFPDDATFPFSAPLTVE